MNSIRRYFKSDTSSTGAEAPGKKEKKSSWAKQLKTSAKAHQDSYAQEGRAQDPPMEMSSLAVAVMSTENKSAKKPPSEASLKRFARFDASYAPLHEDVDRPAKVHFHENPTSGFQEANRTDFAIRVIKESKEMTFARAQKEELAKEKNVLVQYQIGSETGMFWPSGHLFVGAFDRKGLPLGGILLVPRSKEPSRSSGSDFESPFQEYKTSWQDGLCRHAFDAQGKSVPVEQLGIGRVTKFIKA